MDWIFPLLPSGLRPEQGSCCLLGTGRGGSCRERAEKRQLCHHLSDLSAFWTEVGPFPLCADICSSPVLQSLSSSPLHFVIAFCFTGLLHPSPCFFPSASSLQGFLCMNLANTAGRERTAIDLLLLPSSPSSCMLRLSSLRYQAT